jgi:hypothetical protein
VRHYFLPAALNAVEGLRHWSVISAAALHACSRRYMGAARLQWQVLKLHVCACCCPDCCSQTSQNFSKQKASKFKLFKPDNSKNQAFQAISFSVRTIWDMRG